MAVRFDAAADRLLITSSPLDYNAAYTWMAWVYVPADNNTFNTIFALDANSVSQNYDDIVIATSGALFQLQTYIATASETFAAGTTVLTAATWYHITVVRNSATDLKVYLGTVTTPAALEVTNAKDVTGRTAATRMEHGAIAAANGDPFDGRIAAIKAWSTNLSAAEIQQEQYIIRPARFANLYGFWPTFPGSGLRARDYSGNGHDWTEGGTLTDEDPPPISWGTRSLWLPYAASGSAVYNETGQGTLIGVASGADTAAFTEAGQATSAGTASGADTFVLAEAGQGTLIGVASGADTLAVTEAGTGVLVGVASAADTTATAEAGQATTVATASGADALTVSEAGQATSAATASGADAPTWIDAGGGVLVGVASGADAWLMVDAGTGILTGVAGVADTFSGATTYTDAGQATAVGVASGADTFTASEAGQALAAWSSGALDTWVMVDAGTGVLGAVASGSDSGAGLQPIHLLRSGLQIGLRIGMAE